MPISNLYKPVRTCIYCGATNYGDRKNPKRQILGDEHIIPESLNGTLILPQSSCRLCEGITSSFEGVCSRVMFGSMRVHLDFGSKRLKARPKTLPITTRKFGNDFEETIEVPVSEHPSVVIVPVLNRPRLFPLDGDNGEKSVIICSFLSFEEYNRRFNALMQKHGLISLFTSSSLRIGEFKLLLAKIAHSFTVAEYGVDGFYPFLPDIIRTKDFCNLDLYVGAYPSEIREQSEEFHNLTHSIICRGRTPMISIKIALFSGHPVLHEIPYYQVISGRLF